MTYLNKTRPYIFAFLLFSVASSKHIIIYNEELLVALTFLAFVLYIKVFFGQSIQESIDESRNSILQELQSSRVHKRNGAIDLKTIHEKVPGIHRSLQSIQTYVYFLVQRVSSIATKYNHRVFRQQLQLRIKGNLSSQQSFSSIGEKMSESFLPGILVNSQKTIKKKAGKENSLNFFKKNKNNGLKTAKKGIFLLQSTK